MKRCLFEQATQAVLATARPCGDPVRRVQETREKGIAKKGKGPENHVYH
jgi:hypothetical protein